MIRRALIRKRRRKKRGAEVPMVVARKAAVEVEVEENNRVIILTQQVPGEGNDMKEPKVQELSDDCDNDSPDDSSSGNGNRSD
jgi:hypothetical protein